MHVKGNGSAEAKSPVKKDFSVLQNREKVSFLCCQSRAIRAKWLEIREITLYLDMGPHGA